MEPAASRVVLGTSTSGITAAEDAFAHRQPDGSLPSAFDYAHTQDMASLASFVRQALALRGPAMTISTACASSARAFLDAAHLIATGICDAAVVGGADSLCLMTLQGFAALELISPRPCRPCDAARAGISIGEAAASPCWNGPSAARRGAGALALLGAGASSDGYHMSAAASRGRGRIAAMRQALASAGLAPAPWTGCTCTAPARRPTTRWRTRGSGGLRRRGALQLHQGLYRPYAGRLRHPGGPHGRRLPSSAASCRAASASSTSIPPSAAAVVAEQPGSARCGTCWSNAFGFGGINCSLVFGCIA